MEFFIISTATNISGASSNVPIAIEENSMLRKTISCIPFIGMFYSRFQEISLSNKISQTTDVSRLIELANVKNQYKVAAVVSFLLTTAITLATIALGIISATFADCAVAILVCVGIAVLNIYQIYQNNQVVNELQTTGLRQGMRFI